MPPRGNQPQERVCEANWRRSLCAAKRDPRLRGCTPLRTPIRKSEGAGAKRKQYYFSFLTPPPLPPLLSRAFPRTPAVFNGCYNLGRQPAKGSPSGELAEPARPEGFRRAVCCHPFSGNPRPLQRGGRAAALPCPSRARRFTAVRRGRACPVRGFAMLPVNGLNPSGLLRGLRPRKKRPPCQRVTPHSVGRCRGATEGPGPEGLAASADWGIPTGLA